MWGRIAWLLLLFGCYVSVTTVGSCYLHRLLERTFGG